MDQDEMERGFRNVDHRLERVEQILPTLATKADLQAAIELLVTKAGLQAAIEPLATKAELRAAIEPLATKAELQAAIEPLATKAELQETKGDLRAAINQSEQQMRTHFDVATERLHDDIRLIAEGLAVLSQKVDQNHSELKTDIAGVDRRLMRVEAAQSAS